LRVSRDVMSWIIRGPIDPLGGTGAIAVKMYA